MITISVRKWAMDDYPEGDDRNGVELIPKGHLRFIFSDKSCKISVGSLTPKTQPETFEFGKDFETAKLLIEHILELLK